MTTQFVDPSVEPERIFFDERSWADIYRGWLRDANDVFRDLVDGIPWQQGRLWRYERWIDEPRLGASMRANAIAHPALAEAHHAIEQRYGVRFDGIGLAYYRDGRDGQAFHRDRDMRYCEDTIVGILSLGATRPWYVAPRGRRDKFIGEYGGATHDLAPVGGDLMVFGGRFQADWEHSVPQVRGLMAGRISAQWRWTSKRGRPEPDASYRAPRNFSKPRSR